MSAQDRLAAGIEAAMQQYERGREAEEAAARAAAASRRAGSMSTDLIAELRAALDAEEAVARAATQGEWVWSREFVTPPGYHHRTVGPLEPGDAAFIARHHPAFVLADIAAKRALIDQYEAADEDSDDYEHGQHAASLYSAIETLAEAYGIRP